MNNDNDFTELGNWWNLPPGGIPASEYRRMHPNAIYIRPDGFYKWIKDEEFIKIDPPKDDYAQE